MDDSLRDRIATLLEQFADQTTWNPEAWQQVYDLVAANLQNDLLKNVYDDVIHDSGAFHSHNLLGMCAKPGRIQPTGYCQEFRDTASALRLGLSLAEARKRHQR